MVVSASARVQSVRAYEKGLWYRRMPVRRTSRKLKTGSESVQGDLLVQVHPLCPKCKGEGRYLYTVRGGYWKMRKKHPHYTSYMAVSLAQQANAFGKLERLRDIDSYFKQFETFDAFCEHVVKYRTYVEGDRYYSRCVTCNGSGHITPERAVDIWKSAAWRYHHHFALDRFDAEALKLDPVHAPKIAQLIAAYERREREQARIRALAHKTLNERL